MLPRPGTCPGRARVRPGQGPALWRGDLVDRGPHSLAAIDWLEGRFEAVALGNHDRAACHWFADQLRGWTEAPYEHWLTQIDPDEYGRWHQALRAMPLALTIETPHGSVGVIHADAPHPVWARAIALLERGASRHIDNALLGFQGSAAQLARRRSRPVQGLHALVTGHFVVPAVERTANRWNVDTGAGYGGPLSLLRIDPEGIRTFSFSTDGAWYDVSR